MDHLRQIEDDLRNLGTETKRYPEIKDATERALTTLKTIRELYMSDMRKNTETNPCLSQSNDISAPYILLCNYADASPKLINMALSGIQMLLNYEVVPPADVKNILRVLAIQASVPRTEFHLKILQILLLMANSLSTTVVRSQYLTEATVGSFIAQCLKISRDSRISVSVSSTALNTARQIVTLVMDAAAATIQSDSSASSESSQSAQRLVRDISLFSRGLPGEMIKGVCAPQSFSLDLLQDLLVDWGYLFRTLPQFECLLFDCVCPAVKTLLRNLQEDYLAGTVKGGILAAAGLTTRVLRVARVLLLQYATLSPRMLGEVDLLVTLMLHSMQPYRGDTESSSAPDGLPASGGSASSHIRSHLMGLGMSIGMGFGLAAAPSPSTGKRQAEDNGSSGTVSTAISGSFLTLGRPGGSLDSGYNGNGRIPAHPVGCCLEALLSFFLEIGEHCEGQEEGGDDSAPWVSFVSSAMINVVMSASAVLIGGLALDSSLLDFRKATPSKGAVGDRLVLLMEGYLAGGASIVSGETSSDLKLILRALHEYPLLAPAPLGPSEVLFLAFFLTQVVSRLMLRNSIALCAPSCGSVTEPATVSRRGIKASSSSPSPACERVQLFVSTSSIVSIAPSRSPNMQAAMVRVCDSVYEPLEECCAAILTALSPLLSYASEDALSPVPPLSHSESSKLSGPSPLQIRCSWIVGKRAVGVLSELAISAGFLGQSKACSSALSILSRNTVHRLDTLPLQQHQQKYLRQYSADELNSARPPAPWTRYNWGASMQLLQLVHLLADFIPDWDLVVMALDQLSSVAAIAHDHITSSLPSQPRQTSSNKMDWMQPVAGIEGSASILEGSHESETPTAAEAEAVFSAILRFKSYTCLMSDEALVRLMTSLVTLSLNSFGSTMNYPPSSGLNNMGSSDTNDKTGSGSGPAFSGGGGGGVGFNGSGTSSKTLKSTQQSKSCSLPYLQESINQGAVVSYSLQTVIEVTKLNSFRASCIWQMVTSHLRIIASMKNGGTRYFAVAATLDIVKSTLSECARSRLPSPAPVPAKRKATPASSAAPKNPTTAPEPTVPETFLSDKSIFEGILPPLSAILCAHPVHSHDDGSGSPRGKANSEYESLLSAHDILHALKTLAAVCYDDVRTDIISGLLELLQEVGGDAGFPAGAGAGAGESSGWTAILDLLRLVPASMTALSSTPQRALSTETPPPSSSPDGAAILHLSAISAQESTEDTAVSAQEPEWPKAALISAFRVIKLLADEFLESMGLEVIGQLIQCLSVFAAQTADVNISLTSVEMLWKVSDVAMAPPAVPLALAAGATAPLGASVGGFELFQMMLHCLEDLSLDPRPEVRKSAVNTLFSALTAHAAASLLSTAQLRTVCEKSVFPLFQVQLKSESCRRSYLTNGRDEIASAPELKKGIKMNVHHSRDTANKQWSETRTLSLRGLSRLLRTITKSLLLDSEAWFKEDIWNNALELAHSSIETVGDNSADNNNTEISLAAIDLLFAMLKTVSTPPVPTVTAPPVLISKQGSEHRGDDKGKGKAKTRSAAPVEEMVAERESARDDLWQTTWRALKAAVGVRCLTAELALHMCQGLSGLYTSSSDAEFRYSANIQILLEMVVVLSRPRLSAVPDGHQLFFAGASKQRSSVTDIQLHRALIALLKLIRAVDSLAFLSLVSCLSELCFSFQTVLLPAEGRPILLGPCDEKLRMAAGKYLLEIMQASLDDREGPNSGSSSSSPPIEDRDKDVPGIPVVVISRGSALAALDVIVKRFHYDICESAMAARVDSSSRQMGARAESTSDCSALAVTGGSDASSSSGAWFLSSLGRMLSASEVSSPVNPASSSTTPQRRISVGAPMHKFQHARHFIEGMGVMSSSSSSRFRPLFDLTFEIDLLVRSTDACFRITEMDSAAQAHTISSSSYAQRPQPHPQHALSASNRSTSASLSLWSSILSVVACCLSPWREVELMLTVPLIDNPPMPPDSSDPVTVPPPNAVNSLLKILFSSQIGLGTGTVSGSGSGARMRSGSTVGGLAEENGKDKDSSAGFNTAVSQPWRLPLLDVCRASGMLLAHALLNNSHSTAPSSSSSSSLALSGVLTGLWEEMMAIVKSKTADCTLRKKALCGCLDILKCFLAGIVRKKGGDLSRQLCSMCVIFIDDFSTLDTPPSVQLGAADRLTLTPNRKSSIPVELGGEGEDDSAVSLWLLSCHQEVLEASLASAHTAHTAEHSKGGHAVPVRSSINNTGGFDEKIAETRARSHLLLALPSIVSLVCLNQDSLSLSSSASSDEGIRSVRAAACRAVSRIDMIALVDSYSALEERTKQLQADKSQLQAELDSINSSAANLPF